MYAVVEIKGHQYKLSTGDLVDVQKMGLEEGAEVELDQVLFVGGDKPQVGTPTVSGAKLKAKVVRNARSRKVIVFKRKPGQYRRKNGHRQHYTALLITELTDGTGNTSKIDAGSDAAKKYLK